MAHNFLQFNPGASNQETDASYSSDTLRGGGISTNALLPAVLLNKSFYQWSTFIKALADMLSTKGYATSDANVATLASQLSVLMTQADMVPYAPLASPSLTGTPLAPTPPGGDDSGAIPNTYWVRSIFSTFSATNSGYFKMPFANDGRPSLILQWGNCTASSSGPNTVTFPYSFPGGCFVVLVSTNDTGSNWASSYGATQYSFQVNDWFYASGVSRAANSVAYVAIGF